MARAFSMHIYKSKKWVRVSRAFMQSKNYMCEICGAPGKICHHKIWITPQNVDDPEIVWNPKNFMCVCQECHNKIHGGQRKTRFDEDGHVVGRNDATEITNTQEAKELLKLLEET